MTLVDSSAKTRPRDVAAAATLWLPVLAVVVTWLLWSDHLPDLLPRQWGSDGEVSSTGSTSAMAAFAGGVSLGAAILATYYLRERAAPNRRLVYLGLGFAAGLSSCLWLTTAGVTIAAGNEEPKLGAWLLLTFVSFGFGLLPYFLAQKWVTPEASTAATGPDETSAEIGAADATVPWNRTVTSPVIAFIGGVAVLGGGVAVSTLLRNDNENASATVFSVVIIGLILVFLLGFVRVRVSVDQRGLRVVSWLWGIRLKQVSPRQVEMAFADTVSPLQSGGWGYRLTSGRTAVVMRGGPALVVNLRRGNQFAVTVDDPDTAATLLNALAAADPSTD